MGHGEISFALGHLGGTVQQERNGFMALQVRTVCAKDEVISLEMVLGTEHMTLPTRCHTQ